jgi:UDP-N-acetylglucosamine enolpyruvyl transferase
MDYDRQVAIIANDLDSLIHRIEALQAHPAYSTAVSAVMQAKMAINQGRQQIHQKKMEARFEGADNY